MSPRGGPRPRAGRPRLPPDAGARVNLNIRCSRAAREAARAAAHAAGMTLSAWVLAVIDAAAGRR